MSTYVSLTERAIAAHIAWIDAVNDANTQRVSNHADAMLLIEIARDEWKAAMSEQDEQIASGELVVDTQTFAQRKAEQSARNAAQQIIARQSVA
jgi:hypothetical protein